LPFGKHHTPETVGELIGARTRSFEEQTVTTLGAASLRHAYPGSVALISPAPGRPDGELGLGLLEVRLSWPFSAEPPLVLRVDVRDEILRGQWREAATAIGDAVRAGLAARCPAHPNRERHDP
jgi:hypothetical protein